MCCLVMPALSINAVQRWGARPVQLGRPNVKKVACKRRSNSRRVAAGAKLFHTGVNANEQMLQRNSITCSISIRGRGRGVVGRYLWGRLYLLLQALFQIQANLSVMSSSSAAGEGKRNSLWYARNI